MKYTYTLSNCDTKNICNNGIQLKCPKHKSGPINNTNHHYRYSTLLMDNKLQFKSNTNNNPWQNSSTTNYGCKPYNCPQSVLLIKDNPVQYTHLDKKKLSGANRYVSKYHYTDTVNGYATEYDLLKNRDLYDSWSSQLLDEKCKHTN